MSFPLLLKQPESDLEKMQRFGYGAGVEPQLHAVFEKRFGFPLIELWGMTEIVRTISDYTNDRQGRHSVCLPRRSRVRSNGCR